MSTTIDERSPKKYSQVLEQTAVPRTIHTSGFRTVRSRSGPTADLQISRQVLTHDDVGTDPTPSHTHSRTCAEVPQARMRRDQKFYAAVFLAPSTNLATTLRVSVVVVRVSRHLTHAYVGTDPAPVGSYRPALNISILL